MAAELARRRRDMDLLAEVIDQRRSSEAGWGDPFSDPLELRVEDKMLTRVLQGEKNSPRYPTVPGGWGGPAVRRQRRSRRPTQRTLFEDALDQDDDDYEDAFADDFSEEADDDFDAAPLGPDHLPPPELMYLMLEVLAHTGGRAPTQKDIDRILRKDPDLAARLQSVLTALDAAGIAPPGDFDVWPRPGPGTTKNAGDKRRGKRKRSRQNRKR